MNACCFTIMRTTQCVLIKERTLLLLSLHYCDSKDSNLLFSCTIHVVITLWIEEELFMGTQQRGIDDALRWDIPCGVPGEPIKQPSKAWILCLCTVVIDCLTQTARDQPLLDRE